MPTPALSILIAALGSHGDIHPFLGMAKTLTARGHRVTFLAPALYENLLRSLGLEFVPIGTIEQFDRLSANPDLWHPTRAFQVVAQGTCEMLEPYYRAIAERYEPGKTVVAASTLVMGARVAQEVLGIPTVMVHLSPSVFLSADNPPYLPPFPLTAMPLWLRRHFFTAMEWLILDRALAPGVNAFRAKFHLSPVRHIFRQWIHSPQGVIGLFPDWFCSPAPDWPANTTLTGFPLYDEADVTSADPALEKFLAAGPPPIAFTPGSAMRHGQEFFAAAIEACRQLNRRGLLVTRHAENLLPSLPDFIRHVPFAPFGQLLPRCAALAHHGGIGSSAQALAAGIPHLVMPMAHDQPDNAHRLETLGVAAVIPRRKFHPTPVAAALRHLLESPDVHRACADARRKIQTADPLTRTAEIIEHLHANGL